MFTHLRLNLFNDDCTEYCIPPLWSSGQSSWLQIQRSGFDSWRYQTFWEVLVLERGSLSLMSTSEELLGRKSSGSGLENLKYNRRGSAALTTRHLPIRSSIGIVLSWTKATELVITVITSYSRGTVSDTLHPVWERADHTSSNIQSWKRAVNSCGSDVRTLSGVRSCRTQRPISLVRRNEGLPAICVVLTSEEQRKRNLTANIKLSFYRWKKNSTTCRRLVKLWQSKLHVSQKCWKGAKIKR
jgi:hypothetical protein